MRRKQLLKPGAVPTIFSKPASDVEGGQLFLKRESIHSVLRNSIKICYDIYM